MKAKPNIMVLFPLIISLLMILGVPSVSVGQVKDKGPKYGEDSATCVMKISLYREFYKQWRNSDYSNTAVNDAIKHWRWVYFNCPLGTENTYLDGVKMYSHFIKESKEGAGRDKLIDTLMMIYDQRLEYFPNHYRTGKSQEGNILGRKGVDLLQWRPEDWEEVYYLLKRSVDLDGNQSQSAVIVYYFRVALQMVDEAKIGTDVLVGLFDQLIAIVEYNLLKNPSEKADFENVRSYLEAAFEPYASCEDLIRVYSKKFEEQGHDVELLRKITQMLDKKNCTDDPLYFDVTVRLYELVPDPGSAYLIGRMLYKKSDFSEAAEYLQQATEMNDTNARADCYLLLADVYRNLRDYSRSRSSAYKTAELRPGDGNPYILIGDLYASSASDCGDDEIGKKAAFWAAVDKYYKAKSVDPSVEQLAIDRINTYSAAFPTVERIFFHDLKEGESYHVGCWINETTTVRAAR